MAVLELLGETLAEGVLGPIAVAGIAVSLLASSRSRRTLRRWGVRGMAAAMVAAELAARRARAASDGTGGIARQVGQPVVQAASDVQEEWDDFLAEARTHKEERQANLIATSDDAAAGDL